MANPGFARRSAVFFPAGEIHPGNVYHVDSVVSEKEIVFSSVSRYGRHPWRSHKKAAFYTTLLLGSESPEAVSLRLLNHELIHALGLVRGVSHAEFIRARDDGHFYFLECAARVGGAYISEMIEIAIGINLWREWARIEIAGGKHPFRLPADAKRLCWHHTFTRPPGISRYFCLQRS